MSNNSEAIPDIIPGTQAVLEITHLLLDPNNPRYTPEHDTAGGSDTEIIKELARAADLDELIQSITTNGYIDIEPLVVTKHESGKYLVLEGNRRLAAIKVIKDPDLAKECEISVPSITEANLSTLDQVTVHVVGERSEARSFIGFKHINGPHRWDAWAKGRFAAQWYKSESKNGVSIKEIAQKLGDGHNTVRRLVQGIFVLDQARETGIFEISDRAPGRPFAFSHLYIALTRPGYRSYLGLTEEWRASDPQPNPIPQEKIDNLKQVLIWLYGSKPDKISPIIASQNPNLKQLSEVLQKPIATKTLLARNNLEEAYALVYTPQVQFESALMNARQYAEDALAKTHAYDGKDLTLLEAAKQLKDIAGSIYELMHSASTA